MKLIGPTSAAGALDCRWTCALDVHGRRIKEGDRVRSTEDAAKTGTVEEDDRSSNPYRVRWDGGSLSGWLYPRDLQLIVEGRNLSGLMLASSKGLTGVVEGLLGAGAKAELVDEDGRSSLMLALQGGRAKTAMKLIAPTVAAGGLDLQDKQGRSCLMLASSLGPGPLIGTIIKTTSSEMAAPPGCSTLHFSVGEGIKDNTGTTTRRQMVRDWTPIRDHVVSPQLHRLGSTFDRSG